MGRRLLLIVFVFLLVAGGFVLWTLWLAGHFKSIAPHFAGRCTTVEGVVGAEDITIHPRTGVAFVSSADRLALLQGGSPRGAIFAYDTTVEKPLPRNLTPDAGEEFHPHGISLFVGEAGQDVLFVLNHEGGNHTVEVYDVLGDELRHRMSLRDPLLVSPNDIVAVGPDRFYATNDHGNPDGFGRVLEDYLRLPLSNVVHWDGEQFREAAGGIRSANGINVSHDGATVYVSSVTSLAVRVYDRDPRSDALSLREEIPIGTGGDNIEIDGEGRLWIGAHPKLLEVVAHLEDPDRMAPSQVLRVEEREGGNWTVDEVYLNEGEEISAASVAARYGERLLIGAVRDTKMLDCTLP